MTIEDRKVELGTVRVFDHGEFCQDSKEQALKVLEEAAEVVEAWKSYDAARAYTLREFGCETGPVFTQAERLANELADVIQASCNLAFECGIDIRAALDRCEQRNRERGRLS